MRELIDLLSPQFPPAALALHHFVEAGGATEADCACLAQCLWGLAREIVPKTVADESVFEHARTFMAWLVSRSATAREDAKRELSVRKAAALKEGRGGEGGTGVDPVVATGGGGGGGRDSSGAVYDAASDRACAGVEMEDVSLSCCRFVGRLEAGHAMKIIVGGDDLLEGVYSTGGALEKKQELLLGEAEGSGNEGDKSAAESATVEIIPWEAADRLLLACPFTMNVSVLR